MKPIIFISFLLLQSGCLSAQTLQGNVVKVADGDSFTILTRDKKTKKIRLYGIDCPEKGQDFGNVAKQYTLQRCKGARLTIIPKSRDRYKRTVALVLVGRDTLNVLLLKAGLAWHFQRYDNNPVWDRYEQKARKEKAGLWAAKHAMPPWEWRKAQHRNTRLKK